MRDKLKQIERDIKAGKLGMARQRLHTLINLYPTELSLRRRLGDVYAKLQYPERAGCYWYLEEKQTREMEAACAAFVRSCSGHPFVMLRALKFRGGPESLPKGHARSVLQDLSSAAPDYRYPTAKPVVLATPATWGERMIAFGCLTVAVLLFIVTCVGFVTLFKLFNDYVLDVAR